MSLVWSRKCQTTVIPSGPPPVLLQGRVTPESLRAWANATRVYFLKRGYFLKQRGLIYFLDMYFIDPMDHPRQSKAAIQVIETLSDDPPS